MSESTKKEAFSRAKTSNRLIVLTEALSRPQSQELELPQPERGPDMGFDGLLLQLVKGKLKKKKTEVHMSPMTALGSCSKENIWLLLTPRLSKNPVAGLSQ